MNEKTTVELTKFQILEAETHFEILRDAIRGLWKTFTQWACPNGASYDDHLTFLEVVKTFFRSYVLKKKTGHGYVGFKFLSLDEVTLTMSGPDGYLRMSRMVNYNGTVFELFADNLDKALQRSTIEEINNKEVTIDKKTYIDEYYIPCMTSFGAVFWVEMLGGCVYAQDEVRLEVLDSKKRHIGYLYSQPADSTPERAHGLENQIERLKKTLTPENFCTALCMSVEKVCPNDEAIFYAALNYNVDEDYSLEEDPFVVFLGDFVVFCREV